MRAMNSLTDVLDAEQGRLGVGDQSRADRHPGRGHLAGPVVSIHEDAVELFVDRARKARPDFVPDPQQTTTITEICRRLDGMPLAIGISRCPNTNPLAAANSGQSAQRLSVADWRCADGGSSPADTRRPSTGHTRC